MYSEVSARVGWLLWRLVLFLPTWAALCLLWFGGFLAVLVLLVVLIMIITAHVDRGWWDQLCIESLNILPYPILRPWWLFFPPSPLYRLRSSCSEGSTYLSKHCVKEPALIVISEHLVFPFLSCVLQEYRRIVPSVTCDRKTSFLFGPRGPEKKSLV